MPTSRSRRFSACFAMLFSLSHCDSAKSSSTCVAGDPGCATMGGSIGASGASNTSVTGGATNSTSSPSQGGGGAVLGGSTSTGGIASTSGATSTGSTASGGKSASGGTSTASGGSASGGKSASGGTSTASGGTASGGTASGGTASGGTASGGKAASGGTSTATGGVRVDAKGVTLAKPGDQKSASSEYLNLGDFRLLNNKWGSDELNCNTAMKVYVTADKTLGWDFNRGTCGGQAAKPDYPEIEFGIHPFGIGNALETSPPFSSTTLLPLQIKNITSASATVSNMSISLQNATVWNMNFELWLSQRNPVTDPNPGVYAEVIVFWGWKYSDLWTCNATGSVTSDGKAYNLCHQDDQWASGQWRYFHFNAASGSSNSFTGKLDAKAFLDYLVNSRGYSKDLWVTRFEVGSEIDDNTSGSVKINNITFEVNGTSKSVELAN